DSINISVTNEVYNTLALNGASGRFIARNPTASDFTAANPANLGLTADNKIVINFADNPDVDLSSGLEILRPDAQGNLVDARAEFYSYFDLAVNNTVGAKSFIISQKVFTQSANTSLTYNALDTLQLYEGAKSDYTFNYFLRARVTPTSGAVESTGASNYALAQFSVAVEAAGLNEFTEVLQVALVPNNADFGAAGQIILFDANAPTDTSSGASITLNQLAVNSFSGDDAYDLLVEFNNSDAALNNEIASGITITIPQGTAPATGDSSNLASNGGLIDLKLSSTARVPTATTASRPIVDLPNIAGDTFAIGEQIYTRRYDFALAQNLYGEATLIISVQDKDANKNLGRPRTQVITLTVNGPSIDEENQVFTTTATTVIGNKTLNRLREDDGPLSSTAPVAVALSITAGLDQGGLQGQTAGEHLITGFTAANNPRVANNLAQNGLDKNFITGVSGQTFTYAPNGWGVQDIIAEFSVVEPRGFGGTSNRSRTYTQSFPVVVENTIDPTSVMSSELMGFNSQSFGTLGNLLGTGTVTQSGPVTFADNDLFFDTLEGALGSGVVATGVTPSGLAGLPALTFAGSPYLLNILEPVAGSNNLARATLTYSLTLSTTQLDSLLNNVGVLPNFPLDLGFGSGSGTAINGELNVGFALNAEDPSVPVNAISDVTVLEEDINSNDVLGTLTFADGDIARNDVTPYALSIVSVVRQGTSNSVDGLLAWSALTKSTSTAGEASANLIYSKALDDAEVGVYTVTWRLTDSRAATQSFSREQSFTLTVNRFNDSPTLGALSFFDAGEDLNLNTNSAANDGFNVLLSLSDDDFLEPINNRPSFQSATYDSITFSIDQPISSVSPSCVVGSTGSNLFAIQNSPAINFSSIAISGTLNSGAAALTFANIKSSAGCGDPEIGSTLTATAITGVKVDIGGESDLAVAVTGRAYTIQGYRRQTHRMSAGSVSVSPDGATSDISVTIIDGDPDDGVPHQPSLESNSNVRRPASATSGNPGSAWAGVTTNIIGGDCDGVITVGTPGPYLESASDRSTISIPITSVQSATTGSCSLTISSVGEDGVGATIGGPLSTTVEVTIQNAPNFIMTPDFTNRAVLTQDNFNYATDTLEFSGSVRSSDTNDQSAITVNLTTNDFCAVDTAMFVFAGDDNVEYDFATVVRANKPGDCVVTVTAKEDDAIQGPLTQSFNFPEFAPAFIATSLTSVAGANFASSILPGGKSLRSGIRTNAAIGNAPGSSNGFLLTLSATNQDPGDDDRDPGFSYSPSIGPVGPCRIRENGSSSRQYLPSGMQSISYVIEPLNITSGGVCQEISISITEDGQENSFVIAPGSFIFDGVPTFTVSAIPPVTAYGVNIDLTITLISVDGNVGNSSINIINTPAQGSGCARAFLGGFNPTTRQAIMEVIILRPSTSSACTWTLSVTEDGVNSAPQTFNIPLPELAPSVMAISPLAITVDSVTSYRDGISIRTEVTDNDHNDNQNNVFPRREPLLSYLDLTPDVCRVPQENRFLGSFSVFGNPIRSAMASAIVIPLAAGTCRVRVTPDENGLAGTAIEFVITLENVAPIVVVTAPLTGSVMNPT
ncbi:MAG: hypothetical protein K0U41_00460, partial [Gammaproteobacteria bacterium]|nr:hypothetical protein [Gammaproteobacteria bacterium]